MIIYVSIYELEILGPSRARLGSWSEKKRDYVGKIHNKIAEVIWEDCGGHMGRLCNLPI